VVHFRGFFSKLGFFGEFSLFIIIIAGRNIEAALSADRGARSAPFCVFMSFLKRQTRAMNGTARVAKPNSTE
jgi:hypothetical protein